MLLYLNIAQVTDLFACLKNKNKIKNNWAERGSCKGRRRLPNSIKKKNFYTCLILTTCAIFPMSVVFLIHVFQFSSYFLTSKIPIFLFFNAIKWLGGI